MKILPLLLILFDIVFVSGHHAIKMLLSMESTKYNSFVQCSTPHIQSSVNAFLGRGGEGVTGLVDFCQHCKHREFYENKYLSGTKADANVETVIDMVSDTETALDIICPGWDEAFRYQDLDATMKWIIQKRKYQKLPACVDLAKSLILDYGSKGNVDKMTLMSRVVEILSHRKLRLGWAAVAADFKNQDECYLDSCFRVVNALTYFKPEICSHGPVGTFLTNTCPESCAKVESRIVETSLNDCCSNCMGDISMLNDTEKDLIDIHPFKSWKDII
jgi:hypothetical protein